MILLALACLLLVEPPPTPEDTSSSEQTTTTDEGCQDEDCAPYRCDTLGHCDTYCLDSSECYGGTVCDNGDCEEPCVDEDCADGYRCDDSTNDCRVYCDSLSDCQSGWWCCQGSGCPSGVTYGDCYLP